MKPLTREWVEKAEGDFTTAVREMRARSRPNYDASCFHSQQCAEKYMKARLQEANLAFGKTHNLTALLDLALPVEPLWEALRASLQTLNAYAVEVRYPGESADRQMARKALALCTGVRNQVRESLRLHL
ncbi:MAG: HEPN domain-containing protein [Verrucomicrobiia bacterium]|jgi:HEPN domain-containing protein